MKTGYWKTLWLLTLALFWLGSTASALPPAAAIGPTAGDRDLISDGSIVHDAGQVHLNITNFGLLGSWPGTATPFSDAPSARWPGATGDDHLFGAGLWVAGVVLGERLVSTGQYETEIRATDDPLDIIYTMAMGDPGGSRYPAPLPDDDGDGTEDEDPKNGLDDDADGLIDEDFGAISDQHFRCVMRDNTLSAQEAFPDHTPMFLEVVQESFQWSSPMTDQFVGFEFTIRNNHVITIDDVYIGLLADCDIPAGMDGGAGDDQAGSFSGMVTAFDGQEVPVNLAYMYDGDADSPLPGHVGILFLDHTTDPSGESAPPVAALTGLQIFSGQESFDQGGDPTNDDERYEAMYSQGWDPDSLPGQENDHRILIASGPFGELAPNAELKYQVALVMGDGLQDLLHNAANAVVVYQGQSFDRDGDPGNGDEYQVHWLHPEDAPVGAVSGYLTAAVDDGTVQLGLRTSLEAPDLLSISRQHAAGGATRTWAPSEFCEVETSAEGCTASLRDDDPAIWPRTYALYYQGLYRDILLDKVTVELPWLTNIILKAQPNPFNPRIEISYQMPTPGFLSLDIVDVRGQVVRTLVAETIATGSGRVVWLGDDNLGRAVSSGVYHIVAQSDQRMARKRITLLR